VAYVFLRHDVVVKTSISTASFPRTALAHIFTRYCVNAVNVRLYVLVRTCAIIISDGNGDKFVTVGQQKPKILQSKSDVVFGTQCSLIFGLLVIPFR